jgi:hypothetical protein
VLRASSSQGRLVAGSDADFVILDPTQPTLIEDSQQLSKANYTTLKGRAISSRIHSVYLRGNLVAAHGPDRGQPCRPLCTAMTVERLQGSDKREWAHPAEASQIRDATASWVSI